MIPPTYRAHVRSWTDRQPAAFLVGEQKRYSNTIIFDVDEIKQDSDISSERLIGVLAAVTDPQASLDKIALAACPVPGRAVLVVPREGDPMAFIMESTNRVRRAGLMIYSDVVEMAFATQQPADAIEITWDDLSNNVDPVKARTEERPPHLPFEHPIFCVYRGHRMTRPAEPCPFCGVVICASCFRELQECITPGCRNSRCP